jgi:DNA polymerase III delta subunit
MLFGDKEKMHRSLGRNVMEGQHPVIFIDFLAGNFPRNDFTKNTAAHGSSVTKVSDFYQ